MRLHAVIIVALIFVSNLAAQDAQPIRPPRPDELYKSAKDKITEGKYDLAADYLQQFLALNPPPQLYLDLQTRYGSTTFLQLRNVLRWSDNATADAAARSQVEKVIAASEAANASVHRNPERIQKYVNNLVAKTKEERIYARQQLRPAGDAVVKYMVDVLRSSRDREHQSEILFFLTTLNDTTIPAFLAAFEGLPKDIQPAFLVALTNRTDVLDLVAHAETDFTPLLWYLAADPADTALRQTSQEILAGLTGGRSAKQSAAVELTRIALPFFQRKAEFRSLDKVGNKVKVDTWDEKKLELHVDFVTPSRAEEYYGLRNLRWALERKPDYLPAQELFVALATERAVERAKFGDLAKADPHVYGLLAAVPSVVVVRLLDAAMTENRTALALGLIQTLSDRSHKENHETPSGQTERQTPLIKALQYPDARVQFAAAVAILKSPAVVTHGQSARIVDILRRALAGEVDGSGAGKIGRVLIADPDAARGNKLAASFRTAGFTAERLATGRDLIARIARASDYDAIIVDRHIPNPLLGDLLSHIADDPNAARRPTLVVASTDKLQPLPLEHQLLRLALLVAATETDAESLKVLDPDPKPSANNKITRLFEGKEITITVPQARDATLAELMRLRAARLQRLLKSSDLPLNRGLQTRLELRRDQYTLAALAIQYRVNESSAPTINNQLVTLTDVIARRTDLAGEAEKLLPSDLENMVRLIEQLESGLSPEQKKFFEYLREKITPASLALDAEIVRDEAMERRVAKIVKPFRFITVIPETFDPSTLASDLKVAAIDPAKLPRDPEERLAVAKQAADWLRKIAIGEASGYDARSASVELRAALRSDAFADLVVEAVARLATADAQRELVEVASNVKRPSAIRIKAADAALRHIQAFGKMTPAAVAETAAVVAASETDPAVKSRLDVLARQVAVVPVDLSGVIRSFPLTPALPVPPPPKLPDPKEPKEPEPPKM